MTERGRPSTFDRAKADEIIARVASGETLRQVCRDDAMPPESTVRQWALNDVDGFAAQYARARELQMEAWADETIDIADDARNDWIERENARTGATFIELNAEAVARARIRIDQRKWLMSKWKPSTYGERVTHSNDPENPMPDSGASSAIDKLTGVLDRLAARQSDA